MIGKFFCLLVWYLSLIFQILLVSYENSWDIFLSMFINFAHPLWNLRERFSISDIISDNNTVGTLIITASDSLESLLPCGIPNLQFNSFLININSSDFEINTDCWHEIIVENIILKKEEIRFINWIYTYSESQKQWGFSYTWVSNQKNFEEVVAIKVNKVRSFMPLWNKT